MIEDASHRVEASDHRIEEGNNRAKSENLRYGPLTVAFRAVTSFSSTQAAPTSHLTNGASVRYYQCSGVE